MSTWASAYSSDNYTDRLPPLFHAPTALPQTHGPEASLTLFQAYHTAREVLLPPGREAWIDWHSSGLTGKQEVIRPETKAGFTVLPTLDGDNWRNQGSAAPKIAGEVVKSSWLRIQSANCVTVCLV
jgi:hypothetical protein